MDRGARRAPVQGRQAALMKVIDRADALGSYLNTGLPPPRGRASPSKWTLAFTQGSGGAVTVSHGLKGRGHWSTCKSPGKSAGFSDIQPTHTHLLATRGGSAKDPWGRDEVLPMGGGRQRPRRQRRCR